jgi:signal transduction histidine kinase
MQAVQHRRGLGWIVFSATPMDSARLVSRLLQIPLAWKIAGANALLTIALAAGFYLLPAALAGPATSSGLVIGSMFAAAALNVGLITVALFPVRQLERTAEAIWSGATEVRAPRTTLADRDVSRVAGTINNLLEALTRERSRLRLLTSKLVETRTAERATIAQELTESVAQSATALALKCAALKAGESQHDQAALLSQIERVASSLVEEIRRIARDVHPRHIGDRGLESALRSLTRQHSTAGVIDVTLITRGLQASADALPVAVAETLYDVAQEALRNARRHARANRVVVSLGVGSNAVRLRVEDDGCGFDRAALDPAASFGLSLMRERVTLLGGIFEIISRPGRGTCVVAIVPLQQHASTQQDVRTSNSALALQPW